MKIKKILVAQPGVASANPHYINLMKKYNVPAENVVRHFDVTGKLCPAYWTNDAVWKKEFWNKINSPDYYGILQERAGLESTTMAYLRSYKYGDDLIRKLATMK